MSVRCTGSCPGYLSIRAQLIARRLFQWIGRKIYAHPFLIIVSGILLIICFCACAVIYYSRICIDDATKCIENRAPYLWVPRKSTEWLQYTEIIDTFGTYPSVLALTLFSDEEWILSPSNMIFLL